MMRSKSCILAITVVLAACAEGRIIGPDVRPECAIVTACHVSGVDLVLEKPSFLMAVSHARDPLAGLYLMQPGEPFSYVVKVWNRGDQTSAPDSIKLGTATASIQIPALQPGRIFVDTVAAKAPASLGLRADSFQIYLQLASSYADPLFRNDNALSDPLRVALPVVRSTLVFPDTVRAGIPITGRVTLQNLSRFAVSGPQLMAFCIAGAFNVPCGAPGFDPIISVQVPEIGIMGAWTGDVSITIPHHPEARYRDVSWYIMVCLSDPHATVEDFKWGGKRNCIQDSRRMRVISGTGS